MAEAVQVEAKSKKGRKALEHLEVHPVLGGGHMIKHVYSGYGHEPKEYKFKPSEGAKALAHVARHAGLPPGGGASEPQVAEDAE